MTLQAKVEASGLTGTATALEVLSALGLLDAEVIERRGPCPKCGGYGTFQQRWSEASEREFGKADPCPVCKGTGGVSRPVRVVTREAAELAGRAYWDRTRLMLVPELRDMGWDDLSPARRIELMEGALVITAVPLGDVRVVDRIVCGRPTWYGESEQDWGLRIGPEAPDPRTVFKWMNLGEICGVTQEQGQEMNPPEVELAVLGPHVGDLVALVKRAAKP